MLEETFSIIGDFPVESGIEDAAAHLEQDRALLDAYSQAVVDVVEAVGPAVVRVETRTDPARRQRGGTGSGVIISPDGFVLTNSHVVQGEPVVRLALTDARAVEARVLGDDPDTDLALLRTPAAASSDEGNQRDHPYIGPLAQAAAAARPPACPRWSPSCLGALRSVQASRSGSRVQAPTRT